MMSRIRLFVLAAAALSTTSCSSSHDWPMFGRDESRNAVSPETDPPLHWRIPDPWDKEGNTRATDNEAVNLLWKAKLGSDCYAAPIVSDGLVWIGTNNANPRDPARTQDASVLMCFRASDGKFLWQHLSDRLLFEEEDKGELIPRMRPAPYPRYVDWEYSSLRGSPAVEGDRLWFLNNRWEVICLDIGPLRRGTGVPREVWKKDLIGLLGITPRDPGMGIGPGCSIGKPLGDLIFVSTGNGRLHWMPDHEAPKAPALVALDKRTGELVGEEGSGISKRTMMANWSSPVTARVGPEGRPIVIYGGGDGFLYAFDPKPVADPDGFGVFPEVWRRDCNPPEYRYKDGDPSKPLKHGATPKGPCEIIATPVIHHGRVYVGIGLEAATSDGPGNLVCVEATTGRLIWENREVGQTLVSAVIADGRVYTGDMMGYVHALDAETGKTLWRFDTIGLILGSPLLVDGWLHVGTDGGEVFALNVTAIESRARDVGLPAQLRFRGSRLFISHAKDRGIIVPEPGKEGVAFIRDMHQSVNVSPVFAGRTLYVATSEWLYAIRDTGATLPKEPRLPAGPAPAPDARYVPTPHDVVEAMYRWDRLGEHSVVYDLGSGDGRILLAAARNGKARAVGYELNRSLVELSRQRIAEAGLSDRVTVIQEDLLKADLENATVVTLYVGERLNRLLLPKLRGLRKGVSIVSHEFPLPGIKPRWVYRVRSKETRREHTLYFYTTPLTKKTN